MRKQNKAELAALKAAIPKAPDFLVAMWFEGEEKPKPPAGFDGDFILIKSYISRADHDNPDPERTRAHVAAAKLDSRRNWEKSQ